MVPVLILINYKKFVNRKSILMLVGSVSILVFVGHEQFLARVLATLNEIESINNGNLNTSIGYRFQMWESALHLLQQPSLFGIGQNYTTELKALFERGLISEGALNWDHFHNQFFNSIIKYGVVGLIITTTIVFLPLYFSFDKKAEKSSRTIGQILFLSVFTSCLTDIPLNQAASLGVYLTVLLIVFTPSKS
jgi:O-antigen ligase